MSSGSRAILALSAAALGIPVLALPEDRAESSEAAAARSARVVQVTRDSAFLEAGRAQGLGVGTRLTLWRDGHVVGTCEVTDVGDHLASCGASRAEPGDLAALPQAPPSAAPKLPGPRNAPEVMARLREVILLADIPQVAYTGPRATAPAPVPHTEASASAWAATRAGSEFVERIDLSGRDRISSSSEVAVRLAGERWSSSANRQFRPGDPWQLYVWEARVTRGAAPADLTFGRFLPGGAPGQPVMDGVQARRYLRSGASLGIYAGAVPGAITTEPSLRSPAAGVQFASSRAAWGGDVEVGAQGRVGIAGAPGRPLRVEAELVSQAGTRRFDITGSARTVTGGGSRGITVEAVRLDLTARPWEGLAVSSGFRAFEGGLVGTPGLGPVPAATRRGDMEARWSILPWLWLGWEVAAERDVASRLERITLGPRVGATNLLGGRAGVSASWLEERGWWPGRTVDLAWWLKLSSGWRLSGSLALSRWSRAEDGQDLELWGSGAVAAALSAWLDVRATLSATAAGFAAPAASYRGAGGGFAASLAVSARR